ncbi:hypothetical protein [Stenotrophomonas sp. PFBMAA-4]|uniref:hypothetical protein n=1 Tax=Stenotrophomonas sp. PFBMAA-4 TaxID=3043301 RepID=UPI0024B4C793|nr:hypothetical protein [Stenotrophomonas sp. PFBMAA-4]MDI9272434.1 hypothetical protein [Stenotrophomonas sp. PFBMAA-4]
MSNFDWLLESNAWRAGESGFSEIEMELSQFMARSGIRECNWDEELLAWRCRQLALASRWFEVAHDRDTGRLRIVRLD